MHCVCIADVYRQFKFKWLVAYIYVRMMGRGNNFKSVDAFDTILYICRNLMKQQRITRASDMLSCANSWGDEERVERRRTDVECCRWRMQLEDYVGKAHRSCTLDTAC
jgi:hypothetical protein